MSTPHLPYRCDIELGLIGVSSEIGHHQNARTVLRHGKRFVVEFLPVYTPSHTLLSVRRIEYRNRLRDKTGNDSRKPRPLEMERLSRFRVIIFSSAQTPEVLRCAWGNFSISSFHHSDHAIQSKHDPANGNLIDINVHEHFRRHIEHLRIMTSQLDQPDYLTSQVAEVKAKGRQSVSWMGLWKQTFDSPLCRNSAYHFCRRWLKGSSLWSCLHPNSYNQLIDLYSM